jgi:pyridoxal phosphate enzyme (YggS family)
MSSIDARRDELRANLSEVRSRIVQACRAANRAPEDVRLIAVTKFFPASDAALLAELGVTDLGESRDQEAAAKTADFAALSAPPVRWHFVGRLQTNKAKSVAGYADVIHSVDRPELLQPLVGGARRAGRASIGVLIQVSIDADTERGGVIPAGVPALAADIEAKDGLDLQGVMAIAPIDADPEQAFADLAGLSAMLIRQHPTATAISAGMSGDLEAAIRHGATHVRVGTALLGPRAQTFR